MVDEINYDKWNKYSIGDINWVNDRISHLSKSKYVEYIVASDFKNILEIGAGEAIEAQEIVKHKSDISYTILDVSDLFLENAKNLGFITVKGEMHNTGFKNKEFDLVYLCCVLEHSPDIISTIAELSRISKNFYLTMFKWRIKTGGLESGYCGKKGYFSTEFNISMLFRLIKNYGNIKNLFVCTKDNKIVEYYKYLIELKGIDLHRNGNYLTIIGSFKE